MTDIKNTLNKLLYKGKYDKYSKNNEWNELKYCTDCNTKLKQKGNVKFCPNCENVY